MQTRTRRVGEHVEYVEFRFIGIYLYLIDIILLPEFLPAFFDVSVIIFHNYK